ncbi:MAG: aldehyde dehydrogenase family protein [Candidatus Odinarchaeota archaeon]
MKSINPANGSLIREFQTTSKSELNMFITNARKAFQTWKSIDIENRIDYMKSFSNKLEENKDDIVKLIMLEIGKPRIEAETEVLDSIGAIAHYSTEIREVKPKQAKISFENTSGYIEFVPYGVVGLITPWNYPLSLPMWTIVPALLAGNTIIFKPSEFALNVGLKIDELIKTTFPKDIMTTIIGNGEIGRDLVKSDIDKLFFTGSRETGRDIAKNVGLKPVALELGGQDCFIVCEDADIDVSVRGAIWGAIGNCGQVCVAAEKILVNKKIASEFITKLIEETKKVRIGQDIGPIANKKQFEKVKRHINDAVSKGAKLLLEGGKIENKGYFIKPIVLTDLENNMLCVEEETFGPLIRIFEYETLEEAISTTNSSSYGLGVSIWTKNIELGKEIASKLEVGMVWINDINLPFDGGDYWGGIKDSGVGTNESKIMQCLRKRNVLINAAGPREWWFPYNE